MSVIPLYVFQIIFVVLVANLTVSVITVRYRLRDIIVVFTLYVSICFELSLEIFQVFLLSLFHDLFELVCHEFKFSSAHTWAKSMRRVHLQLVQIKLLTLRLRNIR